jgi:ABC-type hemin transport system ATPase subunit
LADAGQLVIITTHDLTLAEQADRLVLLGPDGLLANGLTDAVLKDDTVWARAGIVFPDWFLREQKAKASQ